ncbi:MAG: Serine protease AprX [Frankiales bacterium]|nr:Serine protease AprX [Frankiales bacterium]
MTPALPARRVSLVVLIALGALLGVAVTPSSAAPGASGALDPGLSVTGAALQPVVVTASSVGAAARAVRAAGGVVGRDLPLVDGVAGRVRADRLAQVAADDRVHAVTLDRVGRVQSRSHDDVASASPYVWSTGAAQSWEAGDGHGVAVAVLDTGVSKVRDLKGRLVQGPDLSGENAPAVDSYGHGTVMAGIVAGSGADSGGSPRTGMAPGAKIVSVKVAGANGAADVSTVLAAMGWVAAFHEQHGIRVLNLSWGVPSTQDPAVDPLDAAVEQLWSLGITVVVSAGNSGPDGGTVLKPADDPLVVTVGAYDDQGDADAGNDAALPWSSRGPTAQGLQKPDLVAPGRTLVASRAPGSTVESENPKALVAPSYIRGSGTSQAAAVVSGAAALLLSARPGLSPDQVKAALVRSALPLPGVERTVQGAGRLALVDAGTTVVEDVVSATATARGTGSLDASRGAAARLTVACGKTAKTLDDETTAWCRPWDGQTWTGQTWTGQTWTGQTWTGQTWTGQTWTGQTWTGQTWTGQTWTGQTWTGQTWTGQTWTGQTWTGQSWTGADGEDFLTSFWGDQPDFWQRVPGEHSDPAPRGCRSRADCA